MGASASIAAEDVIPPEIQTLLDVCERQKNKIAEAEADLVEKEMHKMFKGHRAIIDRLTGHTKNQLQRLFLFHASTMRHIDEMIEAGNHYAKFIRQLQKTKEELEWEAITTSSKPDYDEELLVEIIGCSSTEEIQNLDKVFIREKKFCLADLFAAKTKPEAQLRHFVERIFRFDRDESKTVDKNLAIKQAAIIHKAGAARLIGVDEEPILEIISTASRAQCAAINEAYIELYKMKLERAINMKFKGNGGKLLVLWSQSIPSAIVTCAHYLTQKILIDKNAVINFFAKYEKDLLSSADEACKLHYKKTLSDLVNQGVSGTLHHALKGWIELPSPDKGFERILDLYIKSRKEKGLTLNEMLNDQELKGKIHFLIEKQAQEMKLYMIDHKIKLDPGDQAILARSFTSNARKSNVTSNETSLLRRSSSQNIGIERTCVTRVRSSDDGDIDFMLHSPPNEAQEASASVSASPLQPVPELRELEAKHHQSCMTKQSNTVDYYEHKSTKVYEYLVKVFEKADNLAEGVVDTEQFWVIIQGLPLDELGIAKTELSVIRQYSQWDTDGKIYYYEALFEFCDTVIASIESKQHGDNNVLTVIPKLMVEEIATDRHHVRTHAVDSSNKFLLSSKKDAPGRLGLAEASMHKGSVYQYPSIPIFFRQYLMDTLTAFDLNCNGYLTDPELTSLLEVINISHLSVKDFLNEEGVSEFSLVFFIALSL
jgi:hypothetical protein